MAASVHFRNLLLTLILGFLFFATHVKSYPDPRVAGVKERNDDRTALPVPETGLPGNGEGKKSLTKRVDLVTIWNSLPDSRKALIRQMKSWDLPGDGVVSYGASFCYGCIVIVVSSGQKLTIAHLAEVTGNTYNFQNEEAFLANTLLPFDIFLGENIQGLGTRPQAMIFSPTTVAADKITRLAGTIMKNFHDVSMDGIVKATYIRTNAFMESDQNVKGKVTVSWSAPPGGTGTAGLFIFAEENLRASGYYNCQSRSCVFAAPPPS
ncbi:MAG: hypothetical protein M1839_005036 [Geoglossum umbratile]|nr:MAG: hypothetical protein M1839_005036 [Geoglossum umbratile]